MNELSLFSGAAGGLLGTKLLGWECIGYVEFNEYCQRIIRARIDDGILDKAPIFTDVREFLESGAANEYRGFADVVTAGFPCQPFSVAGKQAGADDPRNMWPATIDVIRRVRPQYALLENVPGLLSSGYMGTVFGDLAESGFNAKWRVLSAAETGAPHKRDRLWIVATNTEYRERGWRTERRQGGDGRPVIHGENESMAEPQRERPQRSRKERQRKGQNGLCGRDGENEIQDIPNADSDIIRQKQGSRPECKGAAKPELVSWWEVEPDVGRVANGVASRVDRLKAIGNGQVPAVVRTAWNLLNEGARR